MKKQQILQLINPLLFLSFLVLSVSVIIYRFIPSQLQGDEFLGNLHALVGAAFFILAVVHLILNFAWIKSSYQKKGERK